VSANVLAEQSRLRRRGVGGGLSKPDTLFQRNHQPGRKTKVFWAVCQPPVDGRRSQRPRRAPPKTFGVSIRSSPFGEHWEATVMSIQDIRSDARPCGSKTKNSFLRRTRLTMLASALLTVAFLGTAAGDVQAQTCCDWLQGRTPVGRTTAFGGIGWFNPNPRYPGELWDRTASVGVSQPAAVVPTSVGPGSPVISIPGVTSGAAATNPCNGCQPQTAVGVNVSAAPATVPVATAGTSSCGCATTPTVVASPVTANPCNSCNPCNPCNPCANRGLFSGFFRSFRLGPDFRSQWAQVPVTRYRPVLPTVAGSPVASSTLQPCNTHTWQVRRVPVWSWVPQTTASPIITGQIPAAGCNQCGPQALNSAATIPGASAATVPSTSTTVPGATSAPGTVIGATPSFPASPNVPPASVPPQLDPSEIETRRPVTSVPPNASNIGGAADAGSATSVTPDYHNVTPVPDPEARRQQKASSEVVPRAPSLLDPDERTAGNASYAWTVVPIQWARPEQAEATEAIEAAAPAVVNVPIEARPITPATLTPVAALPPAAPSTPYTRSPRWDDDGWNSAR